MSFQVAKAGFAVRALASAAMLRPDIVLTVHVGLLPVALTAAAPFGAATALFGLGSEVWGPLSVPTRGLIRRCTHLLAISSFTASWLARRAGVDPSQITILPLPVSEQFARVAREPLPPRPAAAPRTLLTVSRLVSEHRYKGHFSVADSLQGMGSGRPALRWLVVGGGDDLDRLRRRCHELGVERDVEFWGSVDERRLLEAYRAADVFVLPSVADPTSTPPVGEGFGLVYAEAGAFGVPSIASVAGGGAIDFVKNGVTGLTVPPGDSTALRSAILDLVDDEEKRMRLGAAARAQVRKRHLPEQFAETLRSALNRADQR